MVPADNQFTFKDFCVMQYEAKKDGTTGLPVSTAAGTPWVSISWYSAKGACQSAGAHLITPGEWTTIARNIEAQSSNDIDGAAGIQLATGHTDNSPANALASDGSDPYYGTGDSSGGAYTAGGAGSSQKRTHDLSNSNVIWDLAGNVWEWVDMQCDTTAWYNSGAWVDWTNANLTDWEKLVSGPSGSLIGTNGAGRYYGCSTTGNALLRGGDWGDTSDAGVFAANLNDAPSNVNGDFGFRCSYAP